MPLTLEPGCIAQRTASTGTLAIRRHLIVTRVFAGMGFAECVYIQKNKRFQWKFVNIPINKLVVLLNAPERISSEALAASQPDPYAYTPGQNGA